MGSQLIFDQKERVGDWVAEQTEQLVTWGDFYAMGVERNGEIIAGTVFNNFNHSNAYQHIAVAKVTKQLPMMLAHGFAYAFLQCRLNRLTVAIEDDNAKSLKLARHAGYVDEFVMPKAGSSGQDMIFMVMWPDQCRWLKVFDNEYAPL